MKARQEPSLKRRLIGLIAVAQGFLLVVLVVLNSFII